MKSRIFISLFLALFVLALVGQVMADDKPCCVSDDKKCAACTSEASVKTTEANQTKCPVMGGDVNKTVFSDHKGKRVYFCCKPCSEAFSKDPDKYLEKMKKEGVILEETPKVSEQKKT